MSNSVDARGLNCPQPVIATKRALDSITEGVITTIVDNAVAKENVAKFATANQCTVAIAEQDGTYILTITKVKSDSSSIPAAAQPLAGTQVFLITRPTLGHGSDELGTVLMKSFFVTLVEKQPYPKAILLLNSGVHLTVNGSPVLDHLRQLAVQGVEILSCGTCLDYYGMKEQLAIGGITNMYTIMDYLSEHKTITL